MKFSPLAKRGVRSLVVSLLSLLMLISLCFATGAVQNEELLLALDPNEMESPLFEATDGFEGKGSASTLAIAQVNTSTYSGKVINIKKGNFRAEDTNKILDDYRTVIISGDLYFVSFPTGTSTQKNEEGVETTYSCDPNNTELPFRSQSVLTWWGYVGTAQYFDGLRIDSEGNLYSSQALNTAIGYQMKVNTWYNVKLIYSAASDKVEIWINGERIASKGAKFREESVAVRFFDGYFSYQAYIKNIGISASNTDYLAGLSKEASADFISYQVTMPDSSGNFKVRILAGINSLDYKSFGYKGVVLTKDSNGNTVSKEITGTDDKAYSSIFGGNTQHTIKELFDYQYACLATVENLDINSSHTELVIFPYTVSKQGNKVYGTPVSLLYKGSNDASDGYPSFSVIEAGSDESLYGHSISNAKFENEGYEPLSYAEKLVDNWFNDLVNKIYPKDTNGNVINHTDLGTFGPTGYNRTSSSSTPGDFTVEAPWKNGTIWTTSSSTNNGSFKVADSTWSTRYFARTLSTLKTSTSTKFLDSTYAETTSQYDSYGGITNAGFNYKATGYFYTQKHTDGRTYIIDPLGNPYFAVSVNTVVFGTGDTVNQQQYILDTYGKKENYFAEISGSLRDMGINTAFVSSSDDLLKITDNGLAVTISATGISAYMTAIGRSTVSEGIYSNNDTVNVFDPGLISFLNQKNAELKKYANMSNVFGYTADNELPNGEDILERYLTLDPSVIETAFSYHTAWTWLAKKLNKPNPTLSDLTSSSNYAAINSEFLAFVYANYYKVVGDSIKAADPNHMYLGARVNGNCAYNEGHLRAAGYYLDIITINLYGGLNPSTTTLSAIYKYSGKPFIVTEFFAKAMDAIDANGYPLANSTGAGVLVNTQADRATYYEHYVLNLLETNACVGWVWYRLRDNDQSLWTYTVNGTTYEDVRLLSMKYGSSPTPNSLILEDGTMQWFSDFYSGSSNSWREEFKQTYKGEGLGSNQNVNKGIYNNNFSSVVTVYKYSGGTLTSSTSYEVEDPSSAHPLDGTRLTTKDGSQTFIINTTSSTQKVILTVYKGQYVALSDSIKNISDNIMGLANYYLTKK